MLCQPVERKSGMQVKRSPDNNALGKQPEEVTVELESLWKKLNPHFKMLAKIQKKLEQR